MVAVQPGRRFRTARVGSGGWLGEAPAADPLTAGQRREELFLLSLATRQVDVIGGQAVVGRDRDAHRAVDARQLLDRQDVLHVAEAGATVLLGKQDAQQTHLARLHDDGPREFLRLVPLGDVGGDLFLGKVPDALAQHVLVVGQREFHDCLQGDKR